MKCQSWSNPPLLQGIVCTEPGLECQSTPRGSELDPLSKAVLPSLSANCPQSRQCWWKAVMTLSRLNNNGDWEDVDGVLILTKLSSSWSWFGCIGPVCMQALSKSAEQWRRCNHGGLAETCTHHRMTLDVDNICFTNTYGFSDYLRPAELIGEEEELCVSEKEKVISEHSYCQFSNML